MPELSIRGGCTPGNSRLGAVSCAHACTNRWSTCAAECLRCQFAPMGGKLRLRLCKRIAHVRGGCTPGNSRLGAVSCAHACTNRWRTCAAQCLGCQFAPMGGKLRLRLCKRAAHVRGGGIFRAKYGSEPGHQFQGHGATGGKKQKEKRPWQTPLAFSL